MLGRCPTCGTYGERDFSRLRENVNKVVCDACTRRTGCEIPFCWICTQPWKAGGKGCGNSNCQVKPFDVYFDAKTSRRFTRFGPVLFDAVLMPRPLVQKKQKNTKFIKTIIKIECFKVHSVFILFVLLGRKFHNKFLSTLNLAKVRYRYIWLLRHSSEVRHVFYERSQQTRLRHTCLYCAAAERHRWYSLFLSTEGWPGWVDLGSWSDRDKFPARRV